MAKPKTKRDSGQDLRAKIFRSGRSQAVRLPKDVRFDEGQKEVRVRREGNRVILESLDEWPETFLAALGNSPTFPAAPERTPLRKARDRFAR
jgi:antitoxin VapB